MKKNLLLVILLLSNFISFGQQRKLRLEDYKTWSLQANVGNNWAHTDVVNNDLFYSGVNYKMGYGLRLNKFLTHNIAFAIDGYRTKFSGVDGIWSYDSQVDYQLSLLGMIQTGNIRFLEEFEKFQLYGYLGYGTISYKSTLKNSNNPSKNNFVHENSQVIPVGIGVKYHLKENVTLNLEYSMNNINGDKLDAFKDRYTENDSYSKIQFGISYTFGKDYHTELEWHDPRPRQTIQTNRRDTVVVIQKIMVPDTTKNNTLIDASNETIEDSSSINNYENVKTIIYYDFNKYELTDSSVSLLNDFVSNYKKLNENNDGINYIVTIESFTDKIGSEKNNKIVVNRRATEVKNFLINSGIDIKSLDIILHGNQAAISGNDAEDRKTIVHVNKF